MKVDFDKVALRNLQEFGDHVAAREPFTIYMTKRNADMTEGRGPMVNDKAFLHVEHANAYIDDQSGCMGRKAKWSVAQYGDWTVEPITVLTGPEVERRVRAMAKAKKLLSTDELLALGLV